MTAPTTSNGFDAAYRGPFTIWGDFRTPKEVKDLAAAHPGEKVLELGCGLGRYSQYMAQQGLAATGVDFSPVAIEKAQSRVDKKGPRVSFLVADVTRLDVPGAPFDVAFDVGCFHCLDADAQRDYVSGVAKMLKPGATLLLWAMRTGPSRLPMSPDVLKPTFSRHFQLVEAVERRRRFVASWWIWFRNKGV
jgi:cyclopropane fatty-acyl-phospholipid synthase-like methyltransferase